MCLIFIWLLFLVFLPMNCQCATFFAYDTAHCIRLHAIEKLSIANWFAKHPHFEWYFVCRSNGKMKFYSRKTKRVPTYPTVSCKREKKKTTLLNHRNKKFEREQEKVTTFIFLYSSSFENEKKSRFALFTRQPNISKASIRHHVLLRIYNKR